MYVRRFGLIMICVVFLAMPGHVSAQWFNRAPDVLPGITAEMRTPGFWTARMSDPDEVMLSTTEIGAMNTRYRERLNDRAYMSSLSPERVPDTEHWWPGFETTMPDFFTLDAAAASDTVRVKILRSIDYVTGRPFANIHHIEYADWEIDAFVSDMALAALPRRVIPRAGLAVRTCNARNIPAFYPFYVGIWKPGGGNMDLFNVSVLDIGEPMTVLHTSRTGEHLFVAYEDGYGWVLAENVALGDTDDVEWFDTTDDFVVSYADRTILYTDADCTTAYGWFGMGDRLPAVTGQDRQVMAPFRQADGSLIFQPVWLAKNATVSHGWLPYTRRNIVRCVFNIVDIPFDWSGGWLGRSAETPYRDIFACFGFDLPFHGRLFTLFGDNTAVTPPLPRGNRNDRVPGDGDAKFNRVEAPEQFGIVNANEPFVTIIILRNGHSQLYMGEVDGDPIIFDDHGYSYNAEDETHYEIKRSVIANMALNIPSYALPNPMRFCTLR
jgi:hypothetical protein